MEDGKKIVTKKINEIILDVLDNTTEQDGRKVTQTKIATELKIKPQVIHDRLKNENMKVNTAIEMLALLGYVIEIRPEKEIDKRKSYIVEKGGVRER